MCISFTHVKYLTMYYNITFHRFVFTCDCSDVDGLPNPAPTWQAVAVPTRVVTGRPGGLLSVQWLLQTVAAARMLQTLE